MLSGLCSRAPAHTLTTNPSYNFPGDLIEIPWEYQQISSSYLVKGYKGSEKRIHVENKNKIIELVLKEEKDLICIAGKREANVKGDWHTFATTAIFSDFVAIGAIACWPIACYRTLVTAHCRGAVCCHCWWCNADGKGKKRSVICQYSYKFRSKSFSTRFMDTAFPHSLIMLNRFVLYMLINLHQPFAQQQ